MSQKNSSRSAVLQSLSVLGLSLSCLTLFFVLKPASDSSITSPVAQEHMQQRTPTRRAQPSPSEALPQRSEATLESLPQRSLSEAPPAAPPTASSPDAAIQVVAPGQIVLSEEQSALLRSSGGWGGSSEEARALVEQIPAEAFTSEW